MSGNEDANVILLEREEKKSSDASENQDIVMASGIEKMDTSSNYEGEQSNELLKGISVFGKKQKDMMATNIQEVIDANTDGMGSENKQSDNLNDENEEMQTVFTKKIAIKKKASVDSDTEPVDSSMKRMRLDEDYNSDENQRNANNEDNNDNNAEFNPMIENDQISLLDARDVLNGEDLESSQEGEEVISLLDNSFDKGRPVSSRLRNRGQIISLLDTSFDMNTEQPQTSQEHSEVISLLNTSTDSTKPISSRLRKRQQQITVSLLESNDDMNIARSNQIIETGTISLLDSSYELSNDEGDDLNENGPVISLLNSSSESIENYELENSTRKLSISETQEPPANKTTENKESENIPETSTRTSEVAKDSEQNKNLAEGKETSLREVMLFNPTDLAEDDGFLDIGTLEELEKEILARHYNTELQKQMFDQNKSEAEQSVAASVQIDKNLKNLTLESGGGTVPTEFASNNGMETGEPRATQEIEQQSDFMASFSHLSERYEDDDLEIPETDSEIDSQTDCDSQSNEYDENDEVSEKELDALERDLERLESPESEIQEYPVSDSSSDEDEDDAEEEEEGDDEEEDDERDEFQVQENHPNQHFVSENYQEAENIEDSDDDEDKREQAMPGSPQVNSEEEQEHENSNDENMDQETDSTDSDGCNEDDVDDVNGEEFESNSQQVYVANDQDAEIANDLEAEIANDRESEIGNDQEAEIANNQDAEIANDQEAGRANDPETEAALNGEGELANNGEAELLNNHEADLVSDEETDVVNHQGADSANGHGVEVANAQENEAINTGNAAVHAEEGNSINAREDNAINAEEDNAINAGQHDAINAEEDNAINAGQDNAVNNPEAEIASDRVNYSLNDQETAVANGEAVVANDDADVRDERADVANNQEAAAELNDHEASVAGNDEESDVASPFVSNDDSSDEDVDDIDKDIHMSDVESRLNENVSEDESVRSDELEGMQISDVDSDESFNGNYDDIPETQDNEEDKGYPPGDLNYKDVQLNQFDGEDENKENLEKVDDEHANFAQNDQDTQDTQENDSELEDFEENGPGNDLDEDDLDNENSQMNADDNDDDDGSYDSSKFYEESELDTTMLEPKDLMDEKEEEQNEDQKKNDSKPLDAEDKTKENLPESKDSIAENIKNVSGEEINKPVDITPDKNIPEEAIAQLPNDLKDNSSKESPKLSEDTADKAKDLDDLVEDEEDSKDNDSHVDQNEKEDNDMEEDEDEEADKIEKDEEELEENFMVSKMLGKNIDLDKTKLLTIETGEENAEDSSIPQGVGLLTTKKSSVADYKDLVEFQPTQNLDQIKDTQLVEGVNKIQDEKENEDEMHVEIPETQEPSSPKKDLTNVNGHTPTLMDISDNESHSELMNGQHKDESEHSPMDVKEEDEESKRHSLDSLLDSTLKPEYLSFNHDDKENHDEIKIGDQYAPGNVNISPSVTESKTSSKSETRSRRSSRRSSRASSRCSESTYNENMPLTRSRAKQLNLKASSPTSEMDGPSSELFEQLQTVISNLYLDSIERLRLDFPPRCAKDLGYCKAHHFSSPEPNSPTNSQLQLLKCALKQERYILYISLVQDMCHRNEFPGETVLIELIELILSFNSKTYNNESLQYLYIKCIELFRFIVSCFPPCWRALRSYYVNFFQSYLDNTKLSSSKTATKENPHKMFRNLLNVLNETLDSCSQEDLSSTRFDTNASQLSQDGDPNQSEVYNLWDWEAQQSRYQTFEALSPANRLERITVVLNLLLFILENDFAMWMLHHHRDPKDKVFGSNETPLVVTLFELTQYTRCTDLVKTMFILFAKATCKDLNPSRLCILERYISLVMIASNTADLTVNEMGIKYPYVGTETKNLIKQFFKLFKSHNLNDVNTYPKTIEMLRQPFLRYEFIDQFLKCFYYHKTGEMCPEKIKQEFIKYRNFQRYRHVYEMDPGTTDELSQEQYINLLLIALKSYCEWHGCLTFLLVRIKDYKLTNIQTTTPTVHKQANDGSGNIMLHKMEDDIDLLLNLLRVTAKVSLPKVDLPKAEVCIDADIIARYCNDLSDIKKLQEALPQLAVKYQDVDFSTVIEYLETFSV